MAAGGRTPDPAELAEDMAELKHMLAEVHAKLDRLPFLRTDVYEARHTSLRNEIALQMAEFDRRLLDEGRRIGTLEDRSTWVSRTAVAGLLLPIIVALVVGALIAGGGT